MKLPFAMAALPLLLAACGGGSNSSGTTSPPVPPPPPPPPTPTLDPQYRASGSSPFAANCDGVPAAGTVYTNAEVEPMLAINPVNTLNMAAAWQQDRWSTGGARGIVTGTSIDGGKTWTQHAVEFSRCGGGTAANGGDYERASDPWISAAADGTLHRTAIAFSGGVLQAGSVSAVLASRSSDGGATWSTTRTLIRDVDDFFNDKCSITADPVTPNHVYAVWDRQSKLARGPTMFARSTDGAQNWETPRAIYDPGTNNQTISNLVVVEPNGTLVNLFLEIHGDANGNTTAAIIQVIRSADNGGTWSAPVRVADLLAVGTRDPDTGATVRDATLVPQIAVAPGGNLYVVWQDARFSNGARDGIALAQSNDGGATWSAPVQVNHVGTVAAFLPSVHVRGDGTVGVTYFDFRDNTSATSTLLTDYWLGRSSNGTQWQENQIAGPFDLDLAPLTTADGGGLFLGDYQALSSAGNVFMPFFAQTINGNASDRTDVYIAPAVSAAGAAAVATAKVAAVAISPTLRRQSAENIARAMRARLPKPD